MLRNHAPYSSIPRLSVLPVVAMTASAIQGDKEKCEKAGMNDYLAKPVRGKTLEKMLVKWALEGKRKAKDLEKSRSFSADPDSDPMSTKSHGPASTGVDDNPTQPASSRSKLPASIAKSADLLGLESEGEHGLLGAEAEERASILRDDKLIAASDPFLQRRGSSIDGSSGPPSPPTGGALTEANIERLTNQQQNSSERRSTPGALETNPDSPSSSDAVGGTSGELSPASTLESLKGGARPRIGEAPGRMYSDSSQKTVTQGSIRKQ